MDVAPATDFGFISSPHRGSHYRSAPSSPNRVTEWYCGFDELLLAAGASNISSHATVPFAWEEKPGVPKTLMYEEDFSFDVSCDLGIGPVPAEDLFHGGVIKTVDPSHIQETKVSRERGRERVFSSARLPSTRSRRTRSLSPLGFSDYRREQQEPTTISTKPSSNVSKRWSFKDLFLFRSASDGRAMDKYPLKKYLTISSKTDKDFKNSCESGSMSKRRGRVSAHELHYNVNRANLNELKKKTYLPYKHGILGGLSFNP